MNYGDDYYAWAFLSTQYSYAYLETDIEIVQMVKLVLMAIPTESQYAQITRDLLV